MMNKNKKMEILGCYIQLFGIEYGADDKISTTKKSPTAT